MQQEPPPLPPSAGGKRMTGSRRTRFAWATSFLGSAAAVLLVVAIIAGFLLVLSQHPGSPRQTTSRALTSTPHGIYFSRPDGVYRLDIQTRKVIWHTEVPGQSSDLPYGFSVLGDTVFTSPNIVPAPGAKVTGVVYALDANTGSIRWKDNFPGPTGGAFEDEGHVYFGGSLPGGSIALYEINPANGKITATYTSGQGSWAGIPPIDGIVYYLSSATSSLDAVDLTSEKLVWQQPIGYDWKSIVPGSITVQNGVVYLEIDQIFSEHHASLIEAFDAKTGSKFWQTPLLPFYQRTDFATNDMLYAGGKNVQAFNVHTHALAWTAPYDTYTIQSYSGRLYIECCTDAPQIVVLNATTGSLIWHLQSKTLGLHLASIFNGVAYVEGFDNIGQSGTIFALDAATGKQLWTMPTGVPYDEWGELEVA
jgi:outer membrane protein assembly factor BamB